LTQAVLDPRCSWALRDHVTTTSSTSSRNTHQCNVCGLLFYPICAPFFPGNFWTSRCDYVRELQPPLDFSLQMDHVRTMAQQLSKQVRVNNDASSSSSSIRDRNDTTTGFTFHMFPPVDACWGTGRYAWEQWITSHPHLQPCDLSEIGNFWAWSYASNQHINQSWWSLRDAPRYAFDSKQFRSNNLPLRQQVLRNSTLRWSNYYLLAGQIHRWIHLYNGTIPKASSWVWKWFPDGDQWWQLFQKYGTRSVEMALTNQGSTGIATSARHLWVNVMMSRP
jgi:hypothetical protein